METANARSAAGEPVSNDSGNSGNRVTFHPSGTVCDAANGSHLLDLARQSRVTIEQTCNAEGTCGKCIVRIRGEASGVTDEERRTLTGEQLSRGYRLACRTIPMGDLEVDVPDAGPLEILSGGMTTSVRPRTRIDKRLVKLPPPHLEDQRDDLTRLLAGAGLPHGASYDPRLLRELPRILREGDWTVTVITADGRLIGVDPGDTRASLYGAAFDIGTTTIVAYLHDLATGRLLDIAASANPQTQFGADVIARINHTLAGPAGRIDLHKAIASGMNSLLADTCARSGIDPKQVFDIAVAGNTTMLHLLAGLPVANIACAPYIPAVLRGSDWKAEDLWLRIHPMGRAYLLPHIASYVGADIVADLLAARVRNRKRLTLLLDFGTNAEIVLGNREKILACSAAAGPCFEGGNISNGMRASRGAICRADWIDGAPRFETIGNAPIAGVCGTGLLDIVALLRRHGLLSETGKLLPPDETGGAPEALRERVEAGEKGWLFRLASPEESATGSAVSLTQRDIRELQAAKAAIAAGVRLLCREWGVETDDIEEVLLAGAFGNNIRVETGKALGLLPAAPKARYRSIGNAAGAGAQSVLLSTAHRGEAERIARSVRYVELSATPAFSDAYMDEMVFPLLDGFNAENLDT